MSTTPPADEDKSEVEINNTPKIKLEEFLQDGPGTGASEPELATKTLTRERGLSSGRVGLVSGGYWRTRMLSSPCAGARVA